MSEMQDYRVKYLRSRNDRLEPSESRFGDLESALKFVNRATARGRHVISVRRYEEISWDVPFTPQEPPHE